LFVVEVNVVYLMMKLIYLILITMKLIRVSPASGKGKKYTATFKMDTGREKSVSFGSAGMRDFTLISNPKSKFYIKEKEGREKVKTAYLSRHRAREDWNNAVTAGALSRWILWNKPSFRASLSDFKKKFKL